MAVERRVEDGLVFPGFSTGKGNRNTFSYLPTLWMYGGVVWVDRAHPSPPQFHSPYYY